MAQGFYNLDEAAQRLGMESHELNQMAQRREVRAFADRGTWRFRVQDIEELARQRGQSSDPDLPLGDDSDVQPVAKSSAKAKSEETFPLDFNPDSVEIFDVPAKKGKAGSDSDIRLVADGSDIELKVDSDSDIRLDPAGGKTSAKPPGSDSKVKLVSESDSDVKIVQTPTAKSDVVPIGMEDDVRSGSDSDVRLDLDMGEHGDSDIRLISDEPISAKPPTKAKADSSPKLDLDEPLLLGEDSAVDAPALAKSASSADSDMSSDFDLSPAADEETTSPSDSGISIEPADAGSGSDDDMDFELTMDEPGEKKKKAAADSDAESSEFELSLDDDAGLTPLEESKTEDSLELPKGEDSAALSDDDTTLEGSSEFELAMEEGSEEDSATSSDLEVMEEGLESDDDVTVAEGESVEELEGEIVDDLITEPGEVEGELVEGEGELVGATAAAPAYSEAPPAEWGAWSLLLIPANIGLLFAGFLLFEMLRSVWSYDKPNFVSGLLSEMLGGMMK